MSTPSSPDHPGPPKPSNGHVSSSSNVSVASSDHSSPGDSNSSDDPHNTSAASVDGSDVETTGARYNHYNTAMTDSDSDDLDAEGEPDGDYDSDSAASKQPASRRQSHSSSASSVLSKRKAEDDDFSLDPELYGLRRSTRSRQTRRIVDSSDESDDDDEGYPPTKRQRTSSTKASKQATPMNQSSASDSESSDYDAGRRNAPTKKQRQRQLLVAQGAVSPSQEVRFSSRRKAAVMNYNEEEGSDSFLMSEDDTTPAYWVSQPVYNGPLIDKFLDHRRIDETKVDYIDYDMDDFEYYVKWQDKAYCHSTWISKDTAIEHKGKRKLDNYFRAHVRAEMESFANKDSDKEQFEQYLLAREALRDSQKDYSTVERIVASRNGEHGTEYYTKWKSLNYLDCTWETEAYASQIAQPEIDHFINRSANRPTSDKRESNPHTRRKFVPLEEQPDYIKFGKLRPFQLQGVNFMAHNWCRNTSVVLADEMGLGKTVQTVAFMNWLRHDRKQNGPFLCVVPLSTMSAWQDTFDNWAPDINYVVYNGTPPSREIIRETEFAVNKNYKKPKFNVLLTTYEYAISDIKWLSEFHWQFFAVDEAHRLKNRGSSGYEKLITYKFDSRLLITGTPIQNTLSELGALFDFILPGGININENVDLGGADASRQLSDLSEAIQPYMIRRTKEKVENDLPPKTEKILRVELSDIQLERYKNILTRNYEALNKGVKAHNKTNLLNICMELKKASNHPFLFASEEEKFMPDGLSKEEMLKALIKTSGKMMLLDQLLTKLKRDGHRVLIFSQMVMMLDLLTTYLKLRNYTHQRLDGTVAAADRKLAIDRFNDPGSQDYCFLLSTRAGGLGINLMTADTVILFDSDWNPQADLQAMARAHRIGQTKPVTVYRLVAKDTIEEEILERARNKRMLEFITIQRGITDNDEKQALSDKVRGDIPTATEDISNILKRRGQKMFEQTSNQKKLEELDIDDVLNNAEEHMTEQNSGISSDGGAEFLKNFEYTDVKVELEWDDIIPKADLEVVKAEMKQRAEEEETQRLLEENAPRKRKAVSNAREERAAKKRALEKAHRADLDEDDDDDDASDDESAKRDPKRPLNTKEVRHLIRAYERYGSLENRSEEMMANARLIGRDIGVVTDTLNEVIDMSKKLVKEEQQRLQDLESEKNRPRTKKDKKAILFDFRDVKKLNAETILDRPVEMRILRSSIQSAPDWRSFRIADATKPASYSCPWGAREDAMLCVGIDKWGYGAWQPIRDDPELGLSDKLYLEEHRVDKKEQRNKADEKNAKSPGAVHLVRRANYLLTVLKDKAGADPHAKRSMENHHRNNKKSHVGISRRGDKPSSVSASPAPPGTARKVNGRTHQAHEHRAKRQRLSGSDRPKSSDVYRDRNNGERRSPWADERRGSDGGERRLAGNGEKRMSSDGHRRSPWTDGRHGSDAGDRRTSGYGERRVPSDAEHKAYSNERRSPSSLHRKPSNMERTPSGHERPSSQQGPSTTSGASSRNPDTKLHKVDKPKPGDEFSERRMRPVRDNLGRLKKANVKNFPQKQTLVKVLRCELIAIGNYIRAETRDNTELEMRLWTYTVRNFWPRHDVTVEKVQDTYHKMLEGEKKAKQDQVPQQSSVKKDENSSLKESSNVQKEASENKAPQQAMEQNGS